MVNGMPSLRLRCQKEHLFVNLQFSNKIILQHDLVLDIINVDISKILILRILCQYMQEPWVLVDNMSPMDFYESNEFL
jgi:hypothetical protein